VFDEVLIGIIRALPDVQSICVGKRIYHQEVLQSDKFSNYPCIAYSLLSDSPFRELGGVSGMRIASFTFQSYSKLASDIRSLSESLQALGVAPAVVLTGAAPLEWIYVDDTTDTFEPCVDLDEKGMKASEQTITVVYRG
jgi:hypothetical protein